MRRRVLSLFMCICMVFSLSGQVVPLVKAYGESDGTENSSTAAQEETDILPFHFAVSQTKGLAGDTVEIRVDIVGNPGIIAACMELS